MRTLIILFFSISLTISFANAEPKISQPAPVLLRAEQNIRVALSNIVEELTFEYPEHNPNTLYIKYRPRKFMIHSGSMTGKYLEKAHETDGPDYKGFILRLSVQKKGEINQAITPQTLKKPYWKTYLEVTAIDDSNKQLFWGLSYGSRTDKQLIATIRKTINDMGTSSNQSMELTRDDAQNEVNTQGRVSSR